MVEICTGAGKCFPEAWNAAARPCDSCNAAAASLFCRRHTAFLCLACDVGHVGDERVWICDVCEQSPASVTCKADAAALCVTCDGDIHSVNPLARRHERVPVVPIYDSAEVVIKSTAGNLLDPIPVYGSTELKENQNSISWGFPTDTTNTNVKFPSGASPADLKSIDLFPDVDHFFDFGFSIPTDARIQSNFHDSVIDSVVPVQTTVPPAKILPPAQIVDHQQSPGTRYEIDFTRSAISSYNKNSSQSISHSVSSSSIDTGIVPDQGNSMSDTSYPFILPVTGGVESTGGVTGGQKAASLSAMDREARVLRYREKRKNRRFEKKIRYASRKAYAETRPRVKGRFAKRTESTAELDVERWLFTAESCGDLEYGVVPSF